MTTTIIVGLAVGISFGCIRSRFFDSEAKAHSTAVSEIRARIKALD